MVAEESDRAACFVATLLAVAVAVATALFPLTASAIAGPATNIPKPGSADDPFPYVPRIITNVGSCTGTLIAPRIVLTAAHCLIGRTTVTVNFGELGTRAGSRWAVNPNYANGAYHDVGYVELETVAPILPMPLYRAQPEVGDYNLRVGYDGVPYDKKYGQTRVDVLDRDGTALRRIGSVVDTGEIFTQPGDSGGPGFIDNRIAFSNERLPLSAYDVRWDRRARDRFLMSTHESGGGGIGGTDYGTVLDERDSKDNLAFVMGALPLPARVEVVHNLPRRPGDLPADTEVGILISAFYSKAGQDYVFNPMLWEEDGGVRGLFDGDMLVGPNWTATRPDDLAGYGFTAGTFPAEALGIHAWRFTTAAALSQLIDGGPGDELLSLTWLLDPFFEYRTIFDLSVDIRPVSLDDLRFAIDEARSEIAGGLAIRGPFALLQPVHEPNPLALLGLGLAGLGLSGRRKA